MKKFALFAAPVALAFAAATPLAAQDGEASEAIAVEEGDEGDMGDVLNAAGMMGGLGAMFGELFKVEPLTEEQSARLPAAESVALKIMPEGAMAEIMKDMIGGFMDPIMSMAGSPAQTSIQKSLGISRFELTELSEEQVEELASIMDPAWKERSEREKNALPEIMGEVAAIMEPTMRKAMAELFAINFEGSELGELDAFFSTAVGSKFARESYKMATDPRILTAAFESAPQIMEKAGDLKKVMDEATAGLPEARSLDDLDDAQKARIAELTGWTVEELQEGYYGEEEAAEGDAVEGEAYEEDAVEAMGD